MLHCRQKRTKGEIAVKKWNAQRVKALLKKILEFILNPRLLLCFGIAWFITNGWSYVFVFLGTYFGITWMSVTGISWLAILWFPFSPEKIVTVFITICLLRWFFPKDQKTLAVIREEQAALLSALRRAKQKRRRKRVARWLVKELPRRRVLKKSN